MWRNRRPLSTGPSASPRGVVEDLSSPEVSADTVSATSGVAHATSWLGPTLRVKGEISGDEDLQIDGTVEGPISLGEHGLTVGQNGQVAGSLAAREIIIHGKVEGNLSASERIDIKKDASVIGDLTSQQIMIEDATCFKGGIEIRKSSEQGESNLDSFVPRTLSKSA